MTTAEAILGRRSIRKYKDEKVNRDLMKEIVDLTRFSPSWANSQIARFTLVDTPEIIKKISQTGVNGFSYNMRTLENANGVAVLSYVQGKSGVLEGKGEGVEKKDFWEAFDSGIACQTFCLAAHEKGIGTCIFGVIDSVEIGKILNLPEGESVAALIVYGIPNQNPTAPKRHEVEDILRFM